MIRADLAALFRAALDSLSLPGDLPVEIVETSDPQHGDFACNFALVASKRLGEKPRDLAERIRTAILDQASPLVQAVEVAGPGFLNFRLNPAAVGGYLARIQPGYARLSHPRPRRINVEFVSVNPNGPITVGSGRGAAFGSALCNVLEAAGHTVHREFYVNDGVNSEQMRQFALSVEALANGEPVPEKGYKGDYVQAVADAVLQGGEKPQDIAGWQAKSQELMIARQKSDLSVFGVEFDTWFSEQSLHDVGQVEKDIAALVEKGVADTEPHRTKLDMGKGGQIKAVHREAQVNDEDDAQGEGQTLWLRSTKFGDDMDRVLRRKDGRLTYIASDVAYHKDKFNRPPNGDKLMTILGPDHHGYVARLHAVVGALRAEFNNEPVEGELEGIEAELFASPAEKAACQAALARSKDELEVVIFQIVRFVKEGKPAPMRKRDGNIYALIDLVDEIGRVMLPEAPQAEQRQVGRDVARFFYLMRSHDTHMDFDIDLATKRSDDNPVFYVQYAHARVCSVLRKATDEIGPGEVASLSHPKELALAKKLLDLPHEVGRCAEDYGVHRLTTYAQEVARSFHDFYEACRVIEPAALEQSRARLQLCEATRIALQEVFGLLGISAPERM